MEERITRQLPVLALRDRVMFPLSVANFSVGRAPSVAAVNFAINSESKDIFVVCQKQASVNAPTIDDLYSIGTVAKVKQILKSPSGDMNVILGGMYRAELIGIEQIDDHLEACVVEKPTFPEDEAVIAPYFASVKKDFIRLTQEDGKLKKELVTVIDEFKSPADFTCVAAFSLAIPEKDKQAILSETLVTKQLELLGASILKELEIIKIDRQIATRVRGQIDKSQKEFYLREQIKAIHSELGDDVDATTVLRQKLEDKHFPEEVNDKAMEELNKMDKMHPSSPEYMVILNYLEWLIDIPFTEHTDDNSDLKKAKEILDNDHFGLEKVKERIVEYLAVLHLTKSLKGPILCFVGPPGVGKTSVAMSIARALNRKFVRMSLGGVKDEAEIRGHRRTYIGAMPGRIMYGLKTVKVNNPVFLLDEIDKISSDMRGDPASALLEVLDPEQNDTFRDRYMEIPYDLSKVMFITTANTLDTIPAPLLDRMEVIELSGYTREEKTEIAKRYLLPKKLKENGISDKKLEITDSGIASIIESYTMEAGVRNLEREISAVCRKVATLVAENPRTHKQTVTEANIEKYLGVKRFIADKSLEKDEIGTATGLAWTAVGGTTLNIEVCLIEGKGEVILTGKLGDVMKESARTAITYIKANAQLYGVDVEAFDKTDIHIHVPEGAVPKDGPSAGITMATAILSALLNKPVKHSLAMTGEITLRGKVLPIGGLKEKALAAYRVGIRDIIIPAENKKDLEDIPDNIRKDMRFIPVADANSVFKDSIVGI